MCLDGKTMPNRDLTYKYIEELTESKMVYYKAILTKDIENKIEV